MIRAPRDVDVLAGLDHGSLRARPLNRRGRPCLTRLVFVYHRRSMTCVVGEQTIGKKTISLRTETRNSKIQDDEDVDVLRRPDGDNQ